MIASFAGDNLANCSKHWAHAPPPLTTSENCSSVTMMPTCSVGSRRSLDPIAQRAHHHRQSAPVIELVSGDGDVDELAPESPWILVVDGDVRATGDLDFATGPYEQSLLLVTGDVSARHFRFNSGAACDSPSASYSRAAASATTATSPPRCLRSSCALGRTFSITSLESTRPSSTRSCVRVRAGAYRCTWTTAGPRNMRRSSYQRY